MPCTDAPIFAQTSGYLQKWYFDIGAEVKAGAVLAEIDTPEVDAGLAQAQAQLKVAEAKRDPSKVTYYQRFQDLFQRNVIAAQDRDTAADNYGQDEATVNAVLLPHRRRYYIMVWQRLRQLPPTTKVD
jgi:multidrug efflux pump subunit AcrA (membrane-fusion protein)